MERELAYLGKALSNPERPFVAMLGGAKVSDKIEVVENLMKVADAMLIGGGMAYTFLKSQGLPIGKSLVEADKLDLARKLLADAKQTQFPLAAADRSRVGRGVSSADTETQIDACDRRRRTAGWASTSGRKRSRNFRRKSRAPRPSCGMGRWAFSRCRRLRRGTLEMAHAVAAATAQRRDFDCRRRRFGGRGASGRAWPTKFRISRPAAARRSNFWPGRKLPGVEALTDKA